MRHIRKLILGLLVAFAGLGVLEIILWISATAMSTDWRVDPLPEHPKYDVLCPLGDMLRLCPDQGPNYERVRPEVFFPIKDKPRIITVGESFVYGLGLPSEQSWPGFLNQQFGGDVEVINMGRCGTYASRLVPIMEAAISLDPDAIILSTGNNEHTMTSFYTGPLGRSPLKSYQTSKVLGRFQLYGLLFRSISGPDIKFKESFTEAPRNFDNELDQKAYAARRRPPDMTQFPDALANTSVTNILEEEQRLKEMIFHDHLQAMIDMTLEADIPLILTTLPRDMAVPPVLSGIHVENEDEVRRIATALLERNPESQEDWVSNGLAVDNKVSLFLYEKAMIHLRNGENEEAIRSIRENMSWELIPDATPEINNIIRESAKDNALALIDLDIYAEAYLSNPQEIFLDKVHVNARGAQEIAQGIAPILAEKIGYSQQ
jgi:lysophospholipase L1-like esterase